MVRSVPFTADVTITDAERYHGFTSEETAGSPAKFRVYAGTDATGILLDAVALSSGETAREFYTLPVEVPGKTIFVDVVSGDLNAALRVSR